MRMGKGVLLSILLAASLPAAADGGECARAHAASPQAANVQLDSAPTLKQLRNATYRGIEGAPERVTLSDGGWAGDPTVPGGASLPRVDLLGDIRVAGDLDGDGVQEAATLLTFNFGGTGVFHYLAVARPGADGPVNVATHPIGDRIQVIDACIDADEIVLDLIRAGPDDPACCPTQAVSLGFALKADTLQGPRPRSSPSTLSPDLIGTGVWVLEQWNVGEEAPAGITLSRADGSVRGRAACNSYSAPLRRGQRADTIRIGPARATRMACEPQAMQAERRFLEQLRQVTRFRFYAGKLVLDWGRGSEFGSMFFTRQP